MIVENAYCDACGEPAKYVVSVALRIMPIGAGAEREKHVIFYWCEQCEANNRKLMTRNAEQKARVARSLAQLARRILRGRYAGPDEMRADVM